MERLKTGDNPHIQSQNYLVFLLKLKLQIKHSVQKYNECKSGHA